MQAVLVGAVETTRVALETLVDQGTPPLALFTLPPSRAHRHSDYVDFTLIAGRWKVPVVPVNNINEPEILEHLRHFVPDYIFVIGWSQICRQELLELPRMGSIGFHPALLPKNRGRAVIPWTILQRQTETGSTLFWLAEGIDSGDILLQEKFAVAPNETSTTLYQKHLHALQRLMCEAIPLLVAGNMRRIPQDQSEATYCAKRTAADGLIDWSLPAESIWTLIRAVTDPYPGAFTYYRGKKLIVWEAENAGLGPYWGQPGQVQVLTDGGALVQCGDGKHVLLTTVQMEAEQRVSGSRALKVHAKLGID